MTHNIFWRFTGIRNLKDGIILCAPKEKIIVGHIERVESQELCVCVCMCVFEKGLLWRGYKGASADPGRSSVICSKDDTGFPAHVIVRSRQICCCDLYPACHNHNNRRHSVLWLERISLLYFWSSQKFRTAPPTPKDI